MIRGALGGAASCAVGVGAGVAVASVGVASALRLPRADDGREDGGDVGFDDSFVDLAARVLSTRRCVGVRVRFSFVVPQALT